MPPRLIASSRMPLQDYSFVASLDDLKIACNNPFLYGHLRNLFAELIANGARMYAVTKERSSQTTAVAALMGITLPLNGSPIQRVYTAPPTMSLQQALNTVYETNPSNFRNSWIFVAVNTDLFELSSAIGFRSLQVPLPPNVNTAMLVRGLQQRSDNLYVTASSGNIQPSPMDITGTASGAPLLRGYGS